MAELAIGVSKTAVEALLNKVKSAIKEEAEQWQIVERDIFFVKDEFEMMQSFLSAASAEQLKNQVARTWVRQKTLPLDQAVAEIKQLKARAEDVSQRNMRYNLIGNSGEQVQQKTGPSPSQMALDIMKPTDAFDIQEDILDLTMLVTMEDKGLQVISVCGTGGDLGTISIIKKTYDDPEICRIFDCRAWVKLVHPFSPHEFVRSLLAEFYTNSVQQQETVIGVDVLARMEVIEQDLHTEFMKTIKNKPYLIIIEDLSSMVEWNAIRTFLPDMKNKSRIVVSTQQLETARLCIEQPNHKWLLREFSTDHSVYAFFKDLPKKQGSKPVDSCQLTEQISGLRDPGPDHWREHHHLFGREPEIKTLGGLIATAYVRKVNVVVSVFGIAGVGKSFLVGAFYDHFVKRFDSCAAISASHPFDIMKFCQKLAHDLKVPEGEDASSAAAAEPRRSAAAHRHSPAAWLPAAAGRLLQLGGRLQHQQPQPPAAVAAVTAAEHADIFHRIWKHLEENQCLVVIDDLRSKEDWDLIEGKLILRASKSCIIVITREESVARHCATSDDAVCRVKGLDADAARNLFDKETRSHDGTANWDPIMMDEAELIVKKCGRLPKLSVALVKYLAEARNDIREVRRLNANFMYALKTSNGLDSFRDVFAWIYSNFRACPHQNLKKCVFYLSIFTQSSSIRRSRLVRRWIAEGYSEGTDSNNIVAYTKKLINGLTNLGMMEDRQQTPSMAGESYCQINSLFLQYVIKRQTEENFFLPLEVCVLPGEFNLKTQHVGQHLAIGSSWKRDKFFLDNMDFSQLRSLTVSREWRPFLVSERMKVLRVLDLEDTNVADDDIRQVVKQLPRLKFLGLRRCVKVSFLPDSLGDLRQLQTLDIRHTSVTKLPKSIRKLQKLQYIRAATKVAFGEGESSTPRRSSRGHVDACDGIMVPRGIGALLALHTLGVVNISARCGKTILNELKNLTQLNKLGVSGINRSNVKGLCSAIVGHSHLESLSLQLHKDKDLDWLGKFTPPRNLRRLKLYVHVVKYPHWSCLQVLGQIKRLHTLSLRFETDQDVELQFCDRLDRNPLSRPWQFSEVKVLEIACSSNLHLKFSAREMAELEMLKVNCLNGSSLQFSGIENPRSLKHVWLKGSFDDNVKEELRRKVAQHPMKPVCKLD